MNLKNKLLGLATMALLALGFATPAAAGQWDKLLPSNGVTCWLRNGDVDLQGKPLYPGDGHLFYCGIASRLNNDGQAVLQKLEAEPAPIRTALQAGNIALYIFADWNGYTNLFNLSSLPSDLHPNTDPGYSVIWPTVGARAMVVQNLGLTAPQTSVTSILGAAMQHEVGHHLDHFLNPPSPQTLNSQFTGAVSGDSVFQAKLRKDVTFFNNLRPCIDIFVLDKVNGKSICTVNSSGQKILVDPYAGNPNFVVLQLLYGNTYLPDTANTPNSWSEMWAELYAVQTSAGTQSFLPGTEYDYYLFNDFICIKTYLNGMRTNGSPPSNINYPNYCN